MANRNLPPCFGILWVPGVMLALRSSRLLWKATAGGLVVSWTPLAITHCQIIVAHPSTPVLRVCSASSSR